MIDQAEIESKAKEFEITETSVEKDYVFGWFIFGIFTVSDLRDTIFLKGGNALRKGYFGNTRYSSDLDFGIPYDIHEQVLLREINKVCDFIQEKSGVTFIKEENKIKEKFTADAAPLPDLKVFEARIYFRDFRNKADHITLKIALDLTRFDHVILPIQTVKLIHPYSDQAELACEIQCMKLEEIIATKLKCLLQRQHAPDLFDYVHSIKLLGGTLNREEVVETLIQKTIFGRNPSVLKNILSKTPFDYFKQTWVKQIVCAKSILFKVEDAIDFFLSEIEELFNIYPDNGYVQFAYFGADLRLPIMEAGRNQTYLKIRYNGDLRIVEPYALKYMQRSDGAQREYLYVYNCSGGNSEPGVRTFVAENIQSIEGTEEKFDPRYNIELSKAGEKPENPYLFDPNKPTPIPKKKIAGLLYPRTKPPRSTKYIYKCSYCGKLFTRTKMNSTLGAHKGKNGYPCGGRHGFYVTSKYK